MLVFLVTTQILLVSAGIVFGMVLWLPMDEGSGDTVYDYSGEGNNGTIYGASWVDGKYGKALSFDGTNDYMTLPNTGLDLTGDMTVYFEMNGIHAHNHMILIRANAPENNGFWIQEKNTKTIKAYWVNAAEGLKEVVGKNNIITDGAWQQITIVKSGTAGKIYVDGVDQTLSSDALINPVSQNVLTYIGCELGTGSFLTAALDEVRIYNRALTAEEVWELYNYNPLAHDYGNIGFYMGILAVVIGLMAYLRSRH